MTPFLTTLLRLSLFGSLLALALFALKPLLRGRVSRTVSYYLWLLVLLRLCIPAGLTLTLPEAPVPAPAPAVPQTAQPVQTDPAPVPPSPVPVETPQAAPTPNPTSEPFPWAAVLTGVWAVGFALCAGRCLLGYAWLSGRIRQTATAPAPEALALLAELEPSKWVRVVESAAVDTPLLLGLFTPVIVLPPQVRDPDRLRDILTHELTHARRHDLLYKWFAALTVSAHWFNPLMILVRREISRACELACDEAVIKTLDAPARQHYGETLLSLAAYHPPSLALPMCGEKRNLKERLVCIVKFEKKGPVAIILTAALVLTLGACSLVSGAQAADAPGVEYDSVYLPKTDATLQLKMPRQRVEKLLGDGVYWHVDDPWTMNDPDASGDAASATCGSVGYKTPDGVVVMEYISNTVVGISFTAEIDPDANMGFSPEAKEMLAEAVPFQVQLSTKTVQSGDTVEQLRAAFPDGLYSRLNPSRVYYEMFGDNTVAACGLSEERGVVRLELWTKEQWGYPSGSDHFYNANIDFGVYTTLNQQELEGYLRAFGPGQEQDGSYLYGSGENAIKATYVNGIDAYPDDQDCILEAIGSAWITARGIHVGNTLADAEACYDGRIYTDQAGRYFQAEGMNYAINDGFRLMLRLNEEDIITSMILIRIGTPQQTATTYQEGLSLPDSSAAIHPGMSQSQAEALLGQGEVTVSQEDIDENIYLDPDDPSVYHGQGSYDASLPDAVYRYDSGIQVGYQDGAVCAITASSLLMNDAPFLWQTEQGLGCGSTLEELKAHYKGTVTQDKDLASYLSPDEDRTATLFDVQEEEYFLQFALIDDHVFLVNLVDPAYKAAWDASVNGS